MWIASAGATPVRTLLIRSPVTSMYTPGTAF
jgi:hypothetical protein